jgi:3-oxoacyl-[acyl-carrier protein] reductase
MPARSLNGYGSYASNGWLGADCVSALSIGNDAESWRKEFETELIGTVNLVDATLSFLEASKAASIIAISIVSGGEIDFAAGPYGTLEASLIHYMPGPAYLARTKGYLREYGVAGQRLFRGWRVASHREERSEVVCGITRTQS